MTKEVNTDTNIYSDHVQKGTTGGGIFGLENILPDEDGTFKGLVLPYEHCGFCYRLAWLSLGSGIYAIHRGYYDLSLVPIGVWATSLNYWRNPICNSWRRYIDISYVLLALGYQMFRARNSENAVAYYSIIGVSVLFYPLSWYFYKIKLTGLATLSHSMIHVFGNVSNIVLYSGFIPLYF